LVDISKKLEKIKQLEKQIEKEREKVNSNLGEELIQQLGIDYELLSTKKEIKEVVQDIKNSMNSNPFQTLKYDEKSSDTESNSNKHTVESVNNHEAENY